MKKLVLFDMFGTIQVRGIVSDEIKIVLSALTKKYDLAVLSSAEDKSVKNILVENKMLGYLHDIVPVAHSSKTERIKNILLHRGIYKEHSIFVSDTLEDIREANESGIKSIGVTWGLHDRETLEKGNPAFVIDSPTELVEAVENALQ